MKYYKSIITAQMMAQWLYFKKQWVSHGKFFSTTKTIGCYGRKFYIKPVITKYLFGVTARFNKTSVTWHIDTPMSFRVWCNNSGHFKFKQNYR